jgi:hypothetical protein
MLVTNIKVNSVGNFCELSADISSEALPKPFTLWYRFPQGYKEYINPNNGNPFLAATLLLAMRTGEELQISKPVSYRLLRSADGPIQDFYKYYDNTLNKIQIKPLENLPLDHDSNKERRGVGLFFSGGVDSFYSLLKNITQHPSDLYSQTHLIVVHGFDIPLTNDGTVLFQELLKNCEKLSCKYGRRILPVTTNLRELSEKFVKWETQYVSAAMASIILALESVLECVYIASTHAYEDLFSWAGSQPMLDPLYQTEGCGIIHDGNEAKRLDKIRFIAQFPLVTEILRVCFINTNNQYNCGRCEKCLRTMIGLHIAGVLDKCSTLPHKIDAEQISCLLIAPHPPFTNELIEALGTTEEDLSIKEALKGIIPSQENNEQLLKQNILLYDVRLQNILNSKSWRITQPLRSVYSWLQKVKSLFARKINTFLIVFNIRNPDRYNHYSLAYAVSQLPVTSWLLRKVFRNRVLIWYWREEKKDINFGDYITAVLLKKFGYKTVEYCNASSLNILDRYDFCLLGVGSELHKERVDLLNIPRLYIWGQGKGHGEFFDIKSDPYANKVKIFAVRGPHTVRQLKLSDETPLGDPAFLMPLFFNIKKDPSQYKITYIPHNWNREGWRRKIKEIGAERYIDIFCSRNAFRTNLREIVSSKFVLTSTLHTAMICHAYRVPWALCLANGDELNFPDKWKDFFEFLGIDNTGNAVQNYSEGLKWWQDVGSKAKIRDLLPLLDSFPLPINNKKVLNLIKKMRSNNCI